MKLSSGLTHLGYSKKKNTGNCVACKQHLFLTVLKHKNYKTKLLAAQFVLDGASTLGEGTRHACRPIL